MQKATEAKVQKLIPRSDTSVVLGGCKGMELPFLSPNDRSFFITFEFGMCPIQHTYFIIFVS